MAKKNNNTTTNTTTAQAQEHAPITRSKSNTQGQNKPEVAQADNKTSEAPAALPVVAMTADKMTLSIPAITAAPAWDSAHKVIFSKYGFTATERTEAGARNSIMSPALGGAVQAILYADAIAATDEAMTALQTAPDEETTAEKNARLASMKSLSEARKACADACPASRSVDTAFRDVHPHAAMLAAIIGRRPLPVQWAAWFKAVKDNETVLDSILSTTLKDGSATLTDAQRATITAGKAAVVEMFATFCKGSEECRQFKLRVLDADVIQWYKMSGRGYTRKGSFKSALAPKHPEKSPLCRAITSWFFGKIAREYTEE